MFELINETLLFQSKEAGNVTGQTYEGSFEVRKVLTPQQKAMADVERRAFLGNPSAGEEIDTEVAELGFAISQLKMRIVKAPKWYTESNNLKNFLDSNVLIELVNAVIQVELDFKANLRDKAQKAKELLSK